MDGSLHCACCVIAVGLDRSHATLARGSIDRQHDGRNSEETRRFQGLQKKSKASKGKATVLRYSNSIKSLFKPTRANISCFARPKKRATWRRHTTHYRRNCASAIDPPLFPLTASWSRISPTRGKDSKELRRDTRNGCCPR